MRNEFEKNKRVFLSPCVVKPAAIALPAADEKKKWPLRFNGHVIDCPCKLCITARLASNTGGKGPRQDGWESQDGVVEGPVQTLENEGGPVTGLVAALKGGDYNSGDRWPNAGIAIPTKKRPKLSLVQLTEPKTVSSNLVYPREDDQVGTRPDRIHSHSLSEDFERTTIDLVGDDDQNDFGGLANMLDASLAEGLRQLDGESSDDTSYRTPEFYHNIFTKAKGSYNWIVPNVLAIGPHPLFTSHLDDLTALKEAGIKAIVSLFDKQLAAKYLKGFHYMFIPTNDGYSSQLIAVCKFIDTQAGLGNPVFIHSFQGKGRAATAAAAYLVYKGWLTAEESIEWVRQHYDESAIETTAQEDAVLKLSLTH